MEQDFIRIGDRYYILATSPRLDDQSRVLKHNDMFAVFDRVGDIRSIGVSQEGLYYGGTRHLNHLALEINGRRPLLLSSTVRQDNALLAVDLCNPELDVPGGEDLPRDVLHIFRSTVLWQGTCYTNLRIRNYHGEPVHVVLNLAFEADFHDLFEVRGMRREQRGTGLEPEVGDHWVELGYRGLDDVIRRTRLVFDRPPNHLDHGTARLEAVIPRQGDTGFRLGIECHNDAEGDERRAGQTAPFETALTSIAQEIERGGANAARIETSNEQFNDWLNRSAVDIELMMTDTAHGRYPYAGIPWYSTPFGRDGLITALEYLWVDPDVARGALAFLARTQSDRHDPQNDAEPGKIVHEMRRGEMAALGEIPFGRYYGTVDATPLFVLLAGAYYRRTADLEFIASIWPNIERALAWIDDYGDADGDGFVEYNSHAGNGLATQGWKDSVDAIHHADGRLAEGSVALCEVQGYVFAAKRAAADLARQLEHPERARELRRQAETLRSRFEDAFWSETLGTYALALDGNKEPCLVTASNAGHCLFTGIARSDRAERVAAGLVSEESFSGWGIRTVANTQVRYNPMSYHNGSVWPHDNALIAAGFARYGLHKPLQQVFTGLFDTAIFADLHRMPELICGFLRRPDEGPTLYPVACAPQSWAAASVFFLLAASIGLEIDAVRQRIVFNRPTLPPWLRQVDIRGLRAGQGVVDLELRRHPRDVSIHLKRRQGDVEVTVVR